MVEILKVIEEQAANKRGDDISIYLFSIHVKLFNIAQRNVLGMIPQKALKSNQVIWAFHTEQS